MLRTPGNESLALAKASQLNLYYIVLAILTFAEHNGIPHFTTSEALDIAAGIGHYEIVELLILDDANNLHYLYLDEPHREAVTSYIPFVESTSFIPYTHIPLKSSQLLNSVSAAVKNHHTFIAEYIQQYYLKTICLKKKLE